MIFTKINKSETEESKEIACPICGKQFVKTEDHKYIVREGYVCSWSCFKKRVCENRDDEQKKKMICK